MKKNHIYISIILSVLSITGCQKFIERTPISQQNSGNFYNTKIDLDQALTAAYSGLRSGDMYVGNGFSSFMEVSSDNTWNLNTTSNGGAFAAFDNYIVDPTNVIVSSTWVTCYNHIQQCNIVINRVNKSTFEDAYKKQRSAEALFLRSLTYFNMVRLWGGVPLITEEVTDVNTAFNHTRESVDNIYSQIIKDLNTAINDLPISYDQKDIGRATKGAAQTLLAQVYLTKKNYNEALALLNTIINSNTYGLVPVFADVFSTTNKNNKESIFAIQFDKSIEGQGYTGADPLMPNSDVNNLPSDNLLKLFEDNHDSRADASIIDVPSQGERIYKWHDTRGPNGGLGFNVIVLRYADVLLMAAECLNEIQYGQTASLNYLNQIRSRSNAPLYSLSELSNQSLFRLAIEKERRLELAFENVRWFDLIRTGRALEVLNNSTGISVYKNELKAHQLLYPIPQSQINASGGKLIQNPGYE